MPDWAGEIRRRLAPYGLRPTREIEIVEEIAQHLQERYSRLRACGASDDEAQASAWNELDGSDVLGRAIAHVERPAPLALPPPGASSRRGWSGSVWQDVRYSARTLLRAPGFTFTVLLALALSIGPLTAIVSVGNWLLWQPHPGVTDSRALAVVWFAEWMGPTSASPSGVSYENLADLRSRARTITGMAGVQESSSSISVPGRHPSQIGTAAVTANFFDVLGVRLSAGRGFSPEEDRGPFGAPVVVISHALARSAFGSPGAALGGSIGLNSRPFSVIGVAPANFGGISSAGGIDVWLTGGTSPYLRHVKDAPRSSRGDGIFYEFVVRAAPGRTFVEVESELKVLAGQLADAHPKENRKFAVVSPRVFPGLGLMPLMRPRMGGMVNTLLAVGGVLLVLGCANVANLLVFRAARREHEIAVRKALGASRLRLLQLQMVESWLLAAAGGALGLALAVYLKQLIEQLLFPKPPGMGFTVPLDLRVLGLTIALALATGTLSALAPAWLLTRTRGLAALGRSTFTWSRAPKLRGTLAVLQLALSLMLLVGALLLISTLRNLRAVDLGLDPSRVTVVNYSLDEHGYDAAQAMAYHRQVLPALEAHGAFEEVSLSALAPFGSSSSTRIIPPGGDAKKTSSVRWNGVSESYFRLLSIPIVRGRSFTADEAAGGGDGTGLIVNETLARQLFGTVDVLGRAVTLAATMSEPERELVIVGVAGDSRWRSIAGEQAPFMYRPFGHYSRVTYGVYMIRSNLAPLRAGEIANAIAARTAGAVPLSMARPLTTGLDRELNRQRLFAWMLSLLAGLGFVLAALGLYGLIAQTTMERRREFGIRRALGAGPGDIVRLVGRYAVAVTSIGIALGLSFSYYGTGIVQHMLFGVTPLDPAVHAAAIVTLAAVVMLACAVPVWRAIRVAPVEVLRAE